MLPQWAHELGSAVAFLHGQHPPIIHRDLKPDNILLTLTGSLKVRPVARLRPM